MNVTPKLMTTQPMTLPQPVRDDVAIPDRRQHDDCRPDRGSHFLAGSSRPGERVSEGPDVVQVRGVEGEGWCRVGEETARGIELAP
jgi:hypothetical protein